MSLPTAARIARRELRGGFARFRILVACLALGVAAIAAVGSVRAAIEAGLARDGAVLLGGDAEMDFTYRFADEREADWMARTARRISEVVDFRSMVTVESGAGSDRALTQVKAIDEAYPLVGTVRLDPDLPLQAALNGQDGLPGAVMDRLLIDRLDLENGDRFRLGDQQFVLMGTILNEPDRVADGFTLGPRTIVSTPALAVSGLLAPGTLFSTRYRLDLPDGQDLAETAAEAHALFGDSGMKWTDARNGAPGIAEFVDRLGAFLVLVGLSGLAVGGIGVSAAVRTYLSDKTPVIATLRTFGADRTTLFQTYFLQIGALSIAGVAIGTILGAALPLVLAPVIESRLPVPAVLSVFPAPLAEAALYGLLTAFIFTLWPLARASEVRAATLFRDALSATELLPPARYLIALATALALLIGLAAWFSGAPRLTLWTAGGLTGALALLSLSAFGIRWLARRALRAARGRPSLRWALSSIGGAQEASASVVLSLGLGLSVLAAVGQVDGNLRRAISGNLPEIAPSFFFVDIQKDQIDGLLTRLDENAGVTAIQTAPMLRGIITRINDRPAREVAGGHWVLDGDRGVTYADRLPEGTRLTAGDWWPDGYNGPPMVSFAAEEAAEMGLSLGDNLTVNIMGREITATIASFREVDFSTAGIGFILSMNPAALAGAPHSFIATVHADENAEATILRDLSDRYPNITAIRVRDAIDRVAGILSGLAAATSLGASATLLTGFLVLIGAAAAGEGARTFEAAVLKTLGASRRRILVSFALRAVLLGAAAGIVALGVGIAAGWAVSTFILETRYSVIWPSAIGILAAGVGATVLAGLGFAWRPLATRPANVLRARE